MTDPCDDQSSASSTDVDDVDADDDVTCHNSGGQFRSIEPPDGGWGWVVVLASFLTFVVVDGISYSFGILYVELLDYFNATKSETSWIGSLVVGLAYLVGEWNAPVARSKILMRLWNTLEGPRLWPAQPASSQGASLGGGSGGSSTRKF